MSALRVPGDKSIAHRALLLSALADGRSRLRGLPDGLDVLATRDAVAALGARLEDDGDAVAVHGTGGRLRAPSAPIDCRNSGTTMRLLTGMLATRDLRATLDGDESLRRRPMRRVAEPLARFGARLALSPQGTAPIVVEGNANALGVDVEIAIPSAQVKSAVLLAALGARGTTRVTGALATRDHTERLLAAFGASIILRQAQDDIRRARDDIRQAQDDIVVEGPVMLRGTEVHIPGDISSAAFLLAAAAAVPNAHVVVDDVGLNPTRTAFLDVLRRFGAEVTVTPAGDGAEPYGTIAVRGASLRAIEIAPPEVPALIDELPLVGVLGAFARGTTTVHGAAELRVKESDRIEAFAAAARALGAEVQTADDGFAVRGPARLRSGSIATHGDHRIAMAFSVAARVAGIAARLDDPGCVAVSFPGFARALEAVA